MPFDPGISVLEVYPKGTPLVTHSYKMHNLFIVTLEQQIIGKLPLCLITDD